MSTDGDANRGAVCRFARRGDTAAFCEKGSGPAVHHTVKVNSRDFETPVRHAGLPNEPTEVR